MDLKTTESHDFWRQGNRQGYELAISIGREISGDGSSFTWFSGVVYTIIQLGFCA